MLKKFLQKDIYVRIVLSYLIIFTFTFLTAIFTYYSIYKISLKNLNDYAKSILSQLPVKIHDEVLQPIDLIQQSINRNPFYLTLLSKPNFLFHKSEIIFEVRNFCNTLKFNYTNPFIAEIGIYIPKENVIISPNFFESSDLFFQYFVTPENIDHDNWIKLFNSSHYNDFYSPITIRFNKVYGNSKRNCIVFLHSLDNWQFNGIKANLFILLDADKLKEYLKDISLYKESNIFILNQKDNILTSFTPNSELLSVVSKLNFQQSHVNIISQINYDKKNWKYFYTIDHNYWKYMVFVPSSTFFKSIYYLKTYIIFFFLISILFGIPFIIILSQKSYHPVNEIKRILLQKINASKNTNIYPANYSNNPDKRESIMLKEIAQLLVREEEKLKQQLIDILPIVQNSFIENLLKGNILTELSNEEINEKYQIKFVSDQFCVILIEIINIDKTLEELSLKHDLLRIIIFNVFEEVLLTDNSKCFNVILSNNILAIVLNMGNDNLNSVEIIKKLEHAISFLEQNFCLYVTVGVSSIKTGISSISDCYYEAETALNYKFIYGNVNVYAFDNIPQQYHRKKSVYISPDIENKIYNAIFEGDKITVANLFELIYEKNIKKSEITTTEAKALCIQMYIIFENACRLINYAPSENLVNYLEKKVISHINSETIQDFFIKMKQMFVQLAQYIERNNLPLNRRVSIEKILEYINKNYSDPNLSLITIADEFKITPQYLSSFFKEKTGLKLSEYLMNLRIEKAKYLLINSPYSINEISQQVGYNYPTNFINAFKKRVGISPAKFRIVAKEEQNN